MGRAKTGAEEHPGPQAPTSSAVEEAMDATMVSAHRMNGIDEEQDRLLASGGTLALELEEYPQDISKERRRSFSLRQGLLYLALLASLAFVAGYISHGEAPAPQADAPAQAEGADDRDGDSPRIHSHEVDAARYGGKLPLVDASFAEFLESGMKTIVARNNGTKPNYQHDSPFAKRWNHKYKQPTCARKWIPYNKRLENDKEICFVHVGKAGGSTLGCLLGFSLHCKVENDIKGLLPIVTTHALHRGVHDCNDSPTPAYYLFVVRDPLARMLSEMNYERPNMTKPDALDCEYKIKELYLECNFWTLEVLAQKGLLSKDEDKKSRSCRNRAFGAITGAGEYLVHGYFNYQYYTQLVFRTEDSKKASTIPENVDNLLVIRNEHMLEDYNKINELIGGQPGALKPSYIPHNNARSKNAAEVYLSDSSKVALCGALCHEIQVYKDLIRHAVNLDQTAVSEAMEELRQKCPKEAAENKCLGWRPDMRERIKETRQDGR